ncbi:hypothetical protein GW571_15060 (plasmid) [Clavibacter capsici]|uniref:RNA polymerase sigma factor 70 region 4 type 2 domain-containing protein n=1 Tax=Clavibacter capsici TaxID=1874630 RepID=A0AAE7CDI9_9MICO|nr:hypothetical protein GW572_15165 [Clavibacter capsici]QIS43549.1 hypothetical protein GW571_15060 [Clavibacter capsici]QIS46514.1 hypothetical protein GW570_15170 [Clavibacter capsici]
MQPADDGADVRDAIDRLSPAHAELVCLIHWDGFAIAEASQIVGFTASTGRTRYERARTKPRSALGHPNPPPVIEPHLRAPTRPSNA